MGLKEYQVAFIKDPYNEVMAGYEDYVGHRLFEYEESHYVLDEFLDVLTTRLSNGSESYDGVLDHLIYFGVSEIDFYDFMRGYEFTRGYIDYFESLIKSDEGRRILASHMLNDILENVEKGMWNDYYEAFFSNCYHYNEHQLSKLRGAILLLYKDEYADEGVLRRHVDSLIATLNYGVNN